MNDVTLTGFMQTKCRNCGQLIFMILIFGKSFTVHCSCGVRIKFAFDGCVKAVEQRDEEGKII